MLKKDNIVNFFIEGAPSEEDFLKTISQHEDSEGCIVVFDDLQDEIQNSMKKNSNILNFENLMTIYSHHKKVSCILLLHYLFQKNMRKISLNCHNLIFTNSPRDYSVMSHLGSQAFPGTKSFLTDSFQDALAQHQYGYLAVSLAPGRSPLLRVATNIFRKQKPPIIYQPQNKGDKKFKKMRLISEAEYSSLLQTGKLANSKQTAPAIINVTNKATCSPVFGQDVSHGSSDSQMEARKASISKTENNTSIYQNDSKKSESASTNADNEDMHSMSEQPIATTPPPTNKLSVQAPAIAMESSSSDTEPRIGEKTEGEMTKNPRLKMMTKKKMFGVDLRKKQGCMSCVKKKPSISNDVEMNDDSSGKPKSSEVAGGNTNAKARTMSIEDASGNTNTKTRTVKAKEHVNNVKMKAIEYDGDQAKGRKAETASDKKSKNTEPSKKKMVTFKTSKKIKTHHIPGTKNSFLNAKNPNFRKANRGSTAKKRASDIDIDGVSEISKKKHRDNSLLNNDSDNVGGVKRYKTDNHVEGSKKKKKHQDHQYDFWFED